MDCRERLDVCHLALALVMAILIGGCATNSLEAPSGGAVKFAKPRNNTQVTQTIRTGGGISQRAFNGASYLGSGRLIGSEAGTNLLQPDARGTPGDGITLNVLGASIPDAAKIVLGDGLGLSYTVDPRVQGTITIQTGRPVSTAGALDLLEAALQSNGAAIVGDSTGIFRIVPLQDAAGFRGRLAVSRTKLAQTGPGVSTQIIPLNFIAASELLRIVKPITAPTVTLEADETRNVLIVTGSRQEIANVLEAAAIFDVDWMQGMSFALCPVQSSDPSSLVNDLNVIFANDKSGPAKGIVRFVPNSRLKSILVISSKPHYIIQAKDWIRRLDVAAAGAEQQLYVYHIQNRGARELADLLRRVFASQTGEVIQTTVKTQAQGDVAPKFEAVTQTTESTEDTGGKGDLQAPPPAPAPAAAEAEGADGDTDPGIKVVADEPNDALLIMCTAEEYGRIRKVLSSIDITPKQVLLEATIAEVALNDQLKFGLKWYFEDGNSAFSFTNLASGFVGAVYPGFNYVFSSESTRVALDALSGITSVNVISSPTLMVLDNRTAVLQVGNQVPIATQQAVGVENPDAPIVNTIEMQDTGVILSVTPRVNENGRVLLDIQQEVSDAIPTTTSGIDSPTIQQRKVKTTVVVDDGETLALGGLIQDQTRVNKTQVPVFGNIPVLGTLFRTKTDTRIRTELLILITPRVVRNAEEAREITEEFRQGIDVVVKRTRPLPDTPAGDIERIVR